MNRTTVLSILSGALLLSALAGVVWAANQDPTFHGPVAGGGFLPFYVPENGYMHLGASCENPRDPSGLALRPNSSGGEQSANYTSVPSTGLCRGLNVADPAFAPGTILGDGRVGLILDMEGIFGRNADV